MIGNMRKLLLIFLLALFTLSLSGVASATPGTQACIGAPADNPVATYNETRQFVDAQSWWKQAGDAEARHLHIGACIPERENLSGTIRIHAKVQLHANPGKVTYVAIVKETADGDTTYFSFNPGWTCPNLGNCAFWTTFDIPSSAWAYSGLQGLRLRATARQPDGKEMRASMNFQDFIANGKTKRDMTRQPYLRGKGWYTGLNYCEASYKSDSTPLPDGPVPAGWAPWIRQTDHGSTDADPTHHDIRLDPDIHAGVPGTFLVDGAGARDGPVAVSASSGLHTLFAKTDCETSAGVNSGVLAVKFIAP